MSATIRPGAVQVGQHVTAYLESGPEYGDVIVLVHGWPETSWAWRHHLKALGSRGYRVIAPDLRGCGGSTVYQRHEDYALRHLVADSVGLLDALGVEHATWIGQDWGAPVVWTTARHHPERFVAAGSLSTPYDTLEYGYKRMASFVRRDVYAEAEYPVGQIDYIAFYHENFAAAQKHFEGDVPAFFTTVMRAGEAGRQDEPFLTATVRRRGGWFDGGPAPRLPLDEAVIDQSYVDHMTEAYERTGFFGINSLYMNDSDNRDFVESAGVRRMTMPTLFVSGRWDYVNDTAYSRLAEPMRAQCTDLDHRVVDAGHWVHHERGAEVIDAIETLAKRAQAAV